MSGNKGEVLERRGAVTMRVVTMRGLLVSGLAWICGACVAAMPGEESAAPAAPGDSVAASSSASAVEHAGPDASSAAPSPEAAARGSSGSPESRGPYRPTAAETLAANNVSWEIDEQAPPVRRFGAATVIVDIEADAALDRVEIVVRVEIGGELKLEHRRATGLESSQLLLPTVVELGRVGDRVLVDAQLGGESGADIRTSSTAHTLVMVDPDGRQAQLLRADASQVESAFDACIRWDSIEPQLVDDTLVVWRSSGVERTAVYDETVEMADVLGPCEVEAQTRREVERFELR